MIRFLTLCLFLSFLACSSEQPSIALNWYSRIDHAPGCGEKNVALIAGKDTLLCPLKQAFFNGDSLVAKSGEKCYFVDLQNITDYGNITDLKEIDCEDFKAFISMNVSTWPKQGIYDQRLD